MAFPALVVGSAFHVLPCSRRSAYTHPSLYNAYTIVPFPCLHGRTVATCFPYLIHIPCSRSYVLPTSLLPASSIPHCLLAVLSLLAFPFVSAASCTPSSREHMLIPHCTGLKKRSRASRPSSRPKVPRNPAATSRNQRGRRALVPRFLAPRTRFRLPIYPSNVYTRYQAHLYDSRFVMWN